MASFLFPCLSISIFVRVYVPFLLNLYVPCQTLPFSSVVFLPAHVISQINEIMLSSPWLYYVTGSDWQDLEKVSPLSIEKYKNNLQVLNAQVASAISNPNTAYVVFSVNGKTLVKKVKEDANFDFSVFRDVVTETRAVLPSLSINGGSQSTTGVFYDSSRTLKMQVDLNASIQNNYYFFEVLNPNAKPSPDDNITTPESVAFSGTGPLWSNTFTWTSYWDANVPGQGFKWEFKGKGTTPSFGFIANCTFSR